MIVTLHEDSKVRECFCLLWVLLYRTYVNDRSNLRVKRSLVNYLIVLISCVQGKSSLNFTTMECAVQGLAHSKELKDLRKKLFTTPLPKPAFKPEPR